MMRKIFLLSILLMLIGCGEKKEYPTNFAESALDQKLFSENGELTTVGEVLETYRGKKIILDIWASWCKDCVVSMPKLANVQKQIPDVEVVMITVDEDETKWKESLEKFVFPNEVKAHQYTFNTGWKKGKLNVFIDFIELDWIPRYMIVDEQGNISNFYATEVTEEVFLQALE